MKCTVLTRKNELDRKEKKGAELLETTYMPGAFPHYRTYTEKYMKNNIHILFQKISKG